MAAFTIFFSHLGIGYFDIVWLARFRVLHLDILYTETNGRNLIVFFLKINTILKIIDFVKHIGTITITFASLFRFFFYFFLFKLKYFVFITIQMLDISAVWSKIWIWKKNVQTRAFNLFLAIFNCCRVIEMFNSYLPQSPVLRVQHFFFVLPTWKEQTIQIDRIMNSDTS